MSVQTETFRKDMVYGIDDFGAEIDPLKEIDSLDCLLPSFFDDHIAEHNASEITFDKNIIEAHSEFTSNVKTGDMTSDSQHLVSDTSTCTNSSSSYDEEYGEAKEKEKLSFSKRKLDCVPNFDLKTKDRSADNARGNGCKKRKKGISSSRRPQDIFTLFQDENTDYGGFSSLASTNENTSKKIYTSLNDGSSLPVSLKPSLSTEYSTNGFGQTHLISPETGSGSSLSVPTTVGNSNFFSNPMRPSGVSMHQYNSMLSSAKLFMKDIHLQNQIMLRNQVNSNSAMSANSHTSNNCLQTTMRNLNRFMSISEFSQSKLQEHDRANGLPKSHSQTMVKSARSRKQLLEGIILSKWDGSPLISYEEGKGWKANSKRKRRVSTESENNERVINRGI